MSSLLSLLSLKSIVEEETKIEKYNYFSCVLALVFCFVKKFIFIYPVKFLKYIKHDEWLVKVSASLPNQYGDTESENETNSKSTFLQYNSFGLVVAKYSKYYLFFLALYLAKFCDYYFNLFVTSSA